MSSQRDSRTPREFLRERSTTPTRDRATEALPQNWPTWPRSGTLSEQRPNVNPIERRTLPPFSRTHIESFLEHSTAPIQGYAMEDPSQNLQNWSNYSAAPRQQLNLTDSRRTQPPTITHTAAPRAQIRAPNYITLGLFRIDPTIPRISLLISAIRRLSTLTGISFWLAAANCFRILGCWGTPWRIIYEFVVGRLSNTPLLTIIWRCLFPGAGYADGHHLRLSVHTSGFTHSPAIYSASIPLYLSGIMAWLSFAALMFISHHLLCFFHDCLTQSRQQFGRQSDP
jgi:hypothetical protein